MRGLTLISAPKRVDVFGLTLVPIAHTRFAYALPRAVHDIAWAHQLT
jgi:hypothetical protein